jgi:hypothetical protein
LGKLFTRILNSRLDTWAEEYYVYIEAQYGFRKGRGTVDNVFILHSIINDYLQNGKRVYALFIDFQKAFDYVVFDNLWFKLIQFGIRGKMFNIIHSMYQNVKNSVLLNGHISNVFTGSIGVRQGDCLSPFLFSMYINDLEQDLLSVYNGIKVKNTKIPLLLYADDAVILAESKEDLQRAINKLYTYCEFWKLKLNTDKSKVIIFKKGPANILEQFHYGNTPLCTEKKLPRNNIFF